jgi:hypothetical protein
MAYDIILEGQDGRKLAYVTQSGAWATIANGTGVITGSPVTLLDAGPNVVAGITAIGTFLVTIPTGCTGTVASNGATVQGTPVTLAAGINTITITAVGAGTINVTLAIPATPTITIEIPGIRNIDAVIEASISGGYKIDPAAVTVAGNKVTVQPQQYLNNTGGAGAATNVPKAVDLSGQTIALTVIGH